MSTTDKHHINNADSKIVTRLPYLLYKQLKIISRHFNFMFYVWVTRFVFVRKNLKTTSF